MNSRGILFLILVIFPYYLASANYVNDKSGQISGVIVDKESKGAIEYATVALYDLKGNLVIGTISKSKGNFLLKNIKKGAFNLRISFLGFKEKEIKNIIINERKTNIDLGKIFLEPSTENLGEVSIIADDASIQYKIDKKIINVSKQFSSSSGTAVDVIQNLPSVRIDIEGNVSLRGSGGFTVLIDGRPTILESNEALQQIPASNIENIELITNPSVKFDPDGTVGIINIITKKKKMQGLSGIVNLQAGIDDKYGGDFLINYRKNNINIFVGANYNHRFFSNYNISEREIKNNDTINYLTLDGESIGGREGYNLRMGVEFNVSVKDFVSLGFRFTDRKRIQSSNQKFEEWNNFLPEIQEFQSIEYGFRGGKGYSISINHKHNFEKKNHELIGYFDFHKRYSDEESNNKLLNNINQILEGSRNIESGPSQRITIKFEYTLPLRKEDKFEAGLQGNFRKSEDNTGLYRYNQNVNEYILQEEYSHKTIYERNIYSVYSLYAGMIGKFGFQAGLRGEYTYRDIASDISQGSSLIDRLDFFPSLHFSYDIAKDFQTMASYSKRIERPRGWYFEPFLVWEDAYNVRMGNPKLIPEYTDSYEFGLIKKFNKNFVSFEGFYRITHNKIERVRSIYSEDVFLRTIMNIGTDYALGAETSLRLKLFRWWESDLSTSIFDYRLIGSVNNISFNTQSFNWDGRFNNTFTITKNTQMQINTRYESPSATSQGESKGFYRVDASLKQLFLQRKFAAVIQLRDVFKSAKRESISSGIDFYYYRLHYHEAPVVMLTLSYNFNSYKKKSEGRNGNEGGDEEF